MYMAGSSEGSLQTKVKKCKSAVTYCQNIFFAYLKNISQYLKIAKTGKSQIIAIMPICNISGNHYTSKEYFTYICITTTDSPECID